MPVQQYLDTVGVLEEIAVHGRHTCMRLQDLHGTTRLAWDYKTYMKLQVQDPEIQVQCPNT